MKPSVRERDEIDRFPGFTGHAGAGVASETFVRIIAEGLFAFGAS